jgi:hypothetical protein
VTLKRAPEAVIGDGVANNGPTCREGRELRQTRRGQGGQGGGNLDSGNGEAAGFLENSLVQVRNKSAEQALNWVRTPCYY